MLKFSGEIPVRSDTDAKALFSDGAHLERSGTGVVNPNVSNGNRCLLGAAWVRTGCVEKAARFPEIMSIDNTCKSNEEQRPLNKIQGPAAFASSCVCGARCNK